MKVLDYSSIIQEILDRLKGVDKKEDGYIALCLAEVLKVQENVIFPN